MPLSPREAGRLVEHILDDSAGREAEAPPAGSGADAGVAGGLPQRIGQCRVRRLIAAGGMGVVYEAEQEGPRRTVAVKVMSRQLAARGKAALRRFEYEAQILARLDHPGIARIYEAGTWDDGTGGVPYFAMEYIPDARDIIEYATAHDLSRRDRLELFAKVCDAVHHGHQKGIIHRDLKPANLIVPESPVNEQSGKARPHGVPQPKVIDFGVARAADTDVSVTTMHTRAGDIVGTLQYMSPEQCEGDPHAIDVRSDVYSLGVVLYELLCGSLPYDLSNTPIPKATRLVQEQEPPSPSQIRPALKGNLEAITLKAIEKSPDDRYQSAAELARDIRRHLAGEPIEARRPGACARMVRSMGKHPVLVTAAACLTMIVLTMAATWASTWYVSFRPHHVERTTDGREARLMSIGDNILHTWSAGASGSITFAQIVSAADGDELAILGFSQDCESQWRGALCAFDLDGDRDEAVWQKRIGAEDLFPELRTMEIDPAGFGVSWGMVEDIFGDVPGPEIVTGFSYTPRSVGAVAVYDSMGELRYRIWNDGGTGGGYWMGEARLLVVSGANAEVDWADRGYEGLDHHPRVIYALQPRLDFLSDTWTTPSPGGSLETVAWYRCLLPPNAAELLAQYSLLRPLPGYDPGLFVTLALHLADSIRGVAWVLDAAGEEVPGTRFANNHWRADPPFADDLLQLDDLPPIVDDASGD